MLNIIINILFTYCGLTITSVWSGSLGTARIIGGSKTAIEKVPYLVNIRRNGVFECGGSLITSRCVLTAAHCVLDSQPKEFEVRAGVTYLQDLLYNSRRVKNIFVHTKYNRTTFDNDIAIFELQTPLKGLNIETIPLSDDNLQTGQYIQVSGWGFTSEFAINPSNQIRTVGVRVFQQQKCRNLYEDYRKITQRMFCASIPGSKDACLADSGGPAVANGKLVGVVSWGRDRECGRVSSPGVYANIRKMKPWIDRILEGYC